MPLSTVLGAQSLIKPGVCTTATRPSAPYVGQMIYDTTLSQTLAYNGSAWVVQTGGLVFINKTTITSSAATTISNIFTSTYNDYRINITIGGVTDSNKLRMQLTTGGTPVTSSYAAGCFIGDYSSGAPTLLNYGYAESANFVLGYVTNSATENTNIFLDCYGPQATQKTAVNGLTTSVWSGAANAGGMFQGFLNLTTSYDGFKIYNSANTNMTGTVTVYGYAKA